jgi:subtilisin family serine protease
MLPVQRHRFRLVVALLSGAAIAAAAASSATATPRPGADVLKPEPVRRQVVVGYSSQQALSQALARFPARIVHRLPQLGAVSVDPEMHRDHFAAGVSALPGITFVNGLRARNFHSEPALVAAFRPGLPYEWQYVATRTNEVPETVLRAAAGVKIAVVDTGADLRHPDLAAKSPETWDIVHKRTDVTDPDGHGTFVATLAAGSVSNQEGIAGFGGDAKLLIVKASGKDGMFTEVDEASAIVYAVDHGAKVINLSLGGEGFSIIEKRAVDYAAKRNVLLVAAGGNEYEDGNPIEYPAALLQPPGSKGQGGLGLAVGASTMAGKRASFSNTGTHISLAAPGDSVFGAVARTSAARDWPRYLLPGSTSGLYGWSSGTSFSTPQVAGAAALVWAANPNLTAQQVATVLKTTASGRGRWTPSLGYGVIDVASAVGAATGQVIRERVQGNATLKLGVWRAKSARARKLAKSRLHPVRVSAWLRTSTPSITPAYRVVTLEIRRHNRWQRIARTTTKSAGHIRWTVGLRRGQHRLRVFYGGRWDLTGAQSRILRLRVR